MRIIGKPGIHYKWSVKYAVSKDDIVTRNSITVRGRSIDEALNNIFSELVTTKNVIGWDFFEILSISFQEDQAK